VSVRIGEKCNVSFQNSKNPGQQPGNPLCDSRDDKKRKGCQSPAFIMGRGIWVAVGLRFGVTACRMATILKARHFRHASRRPDKKVNKARLEAFARSPDYGITDELDFDLFFRRSPRTAFRFQYRFFAGVRFS